MQDKKNDARRRALKRLSDYCILLFLSGYGEDMKDKPPKQKGSMGLGTGGGCLL